jgi:hypothetical protein
MNSTILIAILIGVIVILVLVVVVYLWSTKEKDLGAWSVSRIKVEVWYFEPTSRLWKFWEEVYMEDWLKKNGRYLSEIDPVVAEKYSSANWIAWKDDSSLPKPAEFINRVDFDVMYKPDLSGPYGCSLFDEQVVL